MRRVYALVAFALLVALAAVSPAAGAVEIEYIAWGGPDTLDAHEREGVAFEKKYPNSGVTVKALISGWDEYRDKLYVMASAGTMPDIVMVPNGFWPDMAAQGLFLDLEPYIEKDPDFDPSLLPAGVSDISRVNGHLYTLPTGGFTPSGAMVSLNLDLVASSGLATPENDWTWNDFRDYAKKLTKRRNGNEIQSWGTNLGKTTWVGGWAMHIASNGGHLVDPQGKYIVNPVTDPSRLQITTPEVEASFQFFKDLVDVEEIVLPEGFSSSEAFTTGRLAMQTAWSGTARNNLTNPDIRVGVAPSPMGKGGHHGIWPNVGLPHAYAISSQTENPEAAWKVLKFLISEEEALRARRTDGLGSVAYQPLISIYEEELALPEWKPWLQIGRRYLDLLPTEGNELWKTVPSRAVDALMEEVVKAYNNEQSVRQALEEAERRMAGIMRAEARE